MKTFITSVVLAAGLASALVPSTLVGAAPSNARRPQPLQRARQAVLEQKLELSADQKAQIRQFHASAAATAKAVRENATLTAEQRRAQLADAAKTARAQWQAMLTPAQQEKLATLQAHPRGLDRLAQHRVRTTQIAKQLGLTPEQRTKIQELRRESMTTLRTLRGDASLAPDQRQTKVREAWQANRRQIQQVLTPAQRTKLGRIRQRLLAPLGNLG